MKNKPTAVIMPTYNERENIRRTISEIFKYCPHADILVVDDSSPDGTGQIADRLAREDGRVHVLHRKSKDGIGPAYLAGFSWALSREYELICEMDTDGSHRAGDLKLLLESAQKNPSAGLIIGSRRVGSGDVKNWAWYRDCISRAGSWYARHALGLKVRDMTAGFRVYRAEVLRSLPLKSVHANGYVFQVDMTRLVAAGGFEIKEVPIVFVERKYGKSKMGMKIVLEAMKMVTIWGIQRMLRLGARAVKIANSEKTAQNEKIGETAQKRKTA